MRSSPEQLALLREIAQAAGREILDVYARDIQHWSKDDQSPLTEADLRADAVIREALTRHFPDVYLLSEESASAMPEGGPPASFFLVDPLDGTKEFLKRNDEFTVNIALVHEGDPIAGVVYAPALGEMFYGARGLGAWKVQGHGEPTPMRCTAPTPGATLRVMGSRSHGGDAMDAWLSSLGAEYAFVAAGSSLKFCRIAEGSADIYPRMGPTSQWDTAAAQAVLQAAGGAVLDPEGEPLRYGLERPILNRHFVALAAADMEYPPLD